MFCRARLFALAALISVLGSGGSCSRKAPLAVERLAIPPFENLSGDSALDWVGWGLTEVIATQLTGGARIQPIRLASAREFSLVGATAVLRGYYTIAGGRIRVKASREDLTSRRTVAWFDLEDRFPEGAMGIAGALARRIEPQLRPFDTRSVEALEALSRGRAAGDPAVAAAAYARSVAADPNFGAAYVAWAELQFALRDPASAQSVIAKARARGDQITALRRAELDLTAAAATGDADGRLRALEALGRETPADAELWRQLGREENSVRRFDAAAECYRKAATLDPLDRQTWNQLGYAEALRKNLDGARSALLEYQRLSPKEANPLDSLGDVHFYLGAFADAEKFYLQAYEKDNNFLGGGELYKAARARLMTGDIAGADEIYRRLSDARKAARVPLAGYRDAQWLYLIGRKIDGVAAMQRFVIASSSVYPDGASLAESQLAIWSLEAGAREGVRERVARAGSMARSPASINLAILCRFLADPSISSSILPANSERLVRIYRLLLARQFAEALPLLVSMAAESEATGSGEAGVLLAWALIETGRVKEAAPWLEVYGLPQPGGEGPFVSLIFPREFQLRALVLDRQGRSQQASQMRGIFQKLSGR